MTIIWEASHGIETTIANSAADFIEALRPSNSHWWEGGQCPWVFRGHAREEWALLPSAWRPDNPIIRNCIAEASHRFEVVSPAQMLNWFWHPNFWSSSATFGDNDATLSKQLTIETTAEYLPLWDFAGACDELSMQVPLLGPGPDPIQDPHWLPDPAHPLVGDELLRFSDLPAALALAQHHGIPTRLLDWTRNPVVAAFFAVEPLREPVAGANLVVWALHNRRAKEVAVEGVSFPAAPHGAPRFDPEIAIVRPSTRDNPYLAAQAGLFTTVSRSGIYFMKSGGKRPALEAFVAEANPATIVLRKIALSHKHAADLIEILRRERVSRSALMPTMDNVARDVLTKWAQQEKLS
ncbi:FRG domain-containing protein [Xanthobacter autotrophicus]|uniref:FRG domain-containing protein n=1 Tax=Xanthobacter autotrophicus TaxID=280 RepID=UPI003729C944